MTFGKRADHTNMSTTKQRETSVQRGDGTLQTRSPKAQAPRPPETQPGADSIDSSSAVLPRYLSVKQLAELLHINEKKVYQLANEGEIPCTKVTGKWIFPTQLVENWIFENSHGGVMTDRLVITGSEDTLVQRVATRTAHALQDSAMISYSPCGTLHGLRMLETGRADACFIHWGASEKKALRHLGLVRGFRNHKNWVMVRVLEREQGLAFSDDIASGDISIGSLLQNKSLRWAIRRESAGSTRILDDECKSRHLDIRRLNQSRQVDSERAAMASIGSGLADITCGAQAVAAEYQLHFEPLATVALDLVMTRQTYFRTLIQAFLKEFATSATEADLLTLPGYRVFSDFELLTST